jgi:hypothetical protein
MASKALLYTEVFELRYIFYFLRGYEPAKATPHSALQLNPPNKPLAKTG